MPESTTSGTSVNLIQPNDLWRLLWSREGWRCITSIRSREVLQEFFATNEEAEAYAQKIEARDGFNVYQACATFQEPGNRKAFNVHHVKAFWLDIDCGPGKPYLDQAGAWAALCDFTATRGLPDPLVVASGSGLHCYWILSAPVGPDEWQRGADALKSACQRLNLRADPARTGDIASILRPPGTRNKKSNPPIMVRGGCDNYRPIEYRDWLDRFGGGSFEGNSEPRRETDYLTKAAAAIYQEKPSDANKVAAACGQILAFRDLRGNIPEPQWYASICVVSLCTDGKRLVHEWSSGYPQYTRDETDRKIAHALRDSGPTTCLRFESLNPAPCQACQHRGKITSPIQLGRDAVVVDPAPAALPALPHPYAYRDGRLGVNYTDPATNQPVWKEIHHEPLMISNVARMETGPGMFLTIKRPLRNSVVIRMDADTRLIMKQLVDLAGINVRETKYKALREYISTCIDHLRATKGESVIYNQFGWKDDRTGFLIGNTLLTAPHGEAEEVAVDSHLTARAGLMEPKGSYSGWAVTANKLFAPGYEGQGFTVLAAFAAPLMKFLRNAGGCIVHQVSDTGQGKSLGLRAAWTVYGAEHSIDLNRIDTQNSRFHHLMLLANLPVIFDELRERDHKFAKEFILSFTDGREKHRLGRDGNPLPAQGGWSTLILSASNESLAEVVMSGGEHAQAARVLEYFYRLPNEVDPKKGPRMEREFEANRGQAGRRFLAGIVQPQIQQWLVKSLDAWNDKYLEALGAGTEHRFYANALACCHVAGELLNHWGMLEFTTERVIEVAMEGAQMSRAMILAAVPNYFKLLGRFLTQNLRNALVVEYDSRFERIEPRKAPMGDTLSVRIELKEGYAYFSRDDIFEWCVKQHVHFQKMQKELQKVENGQPGPLVSTKFQKNLGGGTIWDYVGAQECWRVNLVHRRLGRLELVGDQSEFVYKDSTIDRDAREHLEE